MMRLNRKTKDQEKYDDLVIDIDFGEEGIDAQEVLDFLRQIDEIDEV